MQHAGSHTNSTSSHDAAALSALLDLKEGAQDEASGEWRAAQSPAQRSSASLAGKRTGTAANAGRAKQNMAVC